MDVNVKIVESDDEKKNSSFQFEELFLFKN